MNWLKVIGIGSTILGAVASVAGGWADKKNQEQVAAKAAKEAVAELMKKES